MSRVKGLKWVSFRMGGERPARRGVIDLLLAQVPLIKPGLNLLGKDHPNPFFGDTGILY